MTRSLRRFWVSYIAVATVYALATVALWAGPHVEGRFFPVRIEQRIHDTWRVDNRLCWVWAAIKVRDLPSTDIDVYLHVDGYAAPLVTSIFREVDELPWSSAGSAPLGRSDRRYCLTIPPTVAPWAGIQVEMRAWYPGLLGLWRVPLVLPEVSAAGIK